MCSTSAKERGQTTPLHTELRNQARTRQVQVQEGVERVEKRVDASGDLEEMSYACAVVQSRRDVVEYGDDVGDEGIPQAKLGRTRGTQP